MHPEEDRPAEALATALTAAVRRLYREISAGQLPGLTASEKAILADLDGQPGAGPAELAVMEAMKPPSVTRHVKALAARGLIELAPHPSDKRRVRISLTRAGRKMLADDCRNAWLHARIADLDGEDENVLRAAIPLLEGLRR